jgi:pSer/pThr/pTyr-binding forkhead associated (FHA) protein
MLHEQCGEYTVLGHLPFDPEQRTSQLLGHQIDDVGAATVAGPMASQCLYILEDGTDRHVLRFGINTIGRLKDNDVVIRDDHVSRKHCAIVIHANGTAEVFDVASKNGTIVDGVKIHQATPLRHQSVLLLCTRRLKFIVEAVIDPLDGLLSAPAHCPPGQ